MIIGNGLLAKAFAPAFKDDPDVIVFASGVSNSRETRAEEFATERALLEQHLAMGKFLIYFSTCSVHDPELSNSPYVQHKRALEALVQERAKQFAIFRLSQVVGFTPNPFTLTNFLNQQIQNGSPFQVWTNARRNLIDVDDVASIVTHLMRAHQADGLVVNIACPFSVPVLELVKVFEAELGKQANYSTVEAGGRYLIDTALAETTAAKVGIQFDDYYVKKLIRKYYA